MNDKWISVEDRLPEEGQKVKMLQQYYSAGCQGLQDERIFRYTVLQDHILLPDQDLYLSAGCQGLQDKGIFRQGRFDDYIGVLNDDIVSHWQPRGK